jgi:hypothetical protein
LEEIKDAADMAEKWPGATVLNFGEVPFRALAAWVALNPQQTVGPTDGFDVESVEGMFEDWWRSATVAAGRNNGRVPTGSISVTAGETAHIDSANNEMSGGR